MSTKPTTPAKPSITEIIGTVNYYDELAVKKAFDIDFFDLINGAQPLVLNRALIFLNELRGGASHTDAQKTAFSTPLSSLADYFDGDLDEALEEINPTPAGNE